MKPFSSPSLAGFSRRKFLARTSLSLAAAGLSPFALDHLAVAGETAASLPMGSAPAPLDLGWFPSRLHAFVWRNWSLVPHDRMASVVGANTKDLERVGRSMGLEPAQSLNDQQRRRAGLTIIRRNWHLLSYDQLLALLGWSADEMAYTLREDDFFFIKLGQLKPKAAPLRWIEPDAAQAARAAEISKIVKDCFPGGKLQGTDPLFSFVERLSKPPENPAPQRKPGKATDPLRMGYSYFALYGDPLLDPALDPYPDGYLARLAASGVNGVWLQAVLGRLSPLPWTNESHIDQRRVALRNLTERAARHGIRIYLYLNEPRNLPTLSPAFQKNPGWRGPAGGDFAYLCTSVPEVRDGLRDAIAGLCQAVPDLGGFFSITASENPTHCWSHGRGGDCPRCKSRSASEVIAELNGTFYAGIQKAGGRQRLLAWDWGWADGWALDAIERMPAGIELMSVSEWSLPIERGGIKSVVGEYCLSAVGPGPRAQRHWAAARKRGLPVAAKVQLGCSWELSAVPYVPAVDNVARHAAALKAFGVDDLMLGWTLGGHPSPNIDAVAEIAAGGNLDSLARRRHGERFAAAAAKFWRECSAAFSEFPFHIGTVYTAPLQAGPANPLWAAPTGYHASMVGIPYDDLNTWRSIYPANVFAAQLEKVAAGFESAVANLRKAIPSPAPALAEEMTFAEAASIHFASVANQSRFVMARQSGDTAAMRRCADAEALLAIRLHALQSRDSRIGFEASNQYYYIPLDLVEKVLNCRWIAERTKP